MSKNAVLHTTIQKVEIDQISQLEDLVVVEEPLEIRIVFGEPHNRKEISLAVTMRTPGNDESLVTGLLLTEGIITRISDIISLKYCLSSDYPDNVIKVQLAHQILFAEEKYKRNLLSSSSCGICGKAYIDSIIQKTNNFNTAPVTLTSKIIFSLEKKLSGNQSVFQYTGGLHAAALFDSTGKFIFAKEDIGRHNALDKLIGSIEMNNIDFKYKIVLLSGRIGFELVQKCLMANIKTIIAYGAPSSLSVQMAIANKMSLIGFLKKDKFNIYAGSEFIDV